MPTMLSDDVDEDASQDERMGEIMLMRMGKMMLSVRAESRGWTVDARSGYNCSLTVLPAPYRSTRRLGCSMSWVSGTLDGGALDKVACSSMPFKLLLA